MFGPQCRAVKCHVSWLLFLTKNSDYTLYIQRETCEPGVLARKELLMTQPYIAHEILPSGNLVFRAGNEARHDFSRRLCEVGSTEVFHEMMSPFHENGILSPIEPEWIGALTDAPIVAQYHIVEDDGSNTVEGRVWWFPDYAIRDPMSELFHKGRVEFVMAG